MVALHWRGMALAASLLAGSLALPGCGFGSSANTTTAKSAVLAPQRIMRAPKGLLSAAEPQPNGTMWVLAGDRRSRGLFQLDPATGRVLGSISVSNAAQSVAQTSTGVIGLALGTGRAGALELLDSSTAKVRRTIALPSPAHEVVVGSDGTTFYVLSTWPSVASVTIVNSRTGRVQGSVPVPRETVSVVPDVQQATLYALDSNGLVSQIGIAGGRVRARFPVGDSGTSLAMSPDGATLYALKDTGNVPNIAVTSIATESVRRALPAPADCLQILTAPGGHQLYDVVGTRDYGNVQIFKA